MSLIRVLVAEDDKSIASLIRRVLSEDGYAIDVAHTGEDARLLAFVNQYDGIVLDLELGDRHGFEVLQEMRAAGKTTPVLLYTGTEDVTAIVRGLDAGADEYVVKPVSNQELRARVRSLLRRGPGSRATEQLRVGDLVLNRLTRRVTAGTFVLDLTPMELKLLEHLMMNAGKIVTRGDLHDKVWDMHFDPSSNLVDAHVARLRKKIYAVPCGVSLVTRRGIGFVLDAQGGESSTEAHEEYGLNKAQV
ncbi:MAG TPA: response regulator transcription factor [Gemmatimonadaceae bacterium]|nr:response regulator transcription factor [Gemmatimonadaceae bacterium]